MKRTLPLALIAALFLNACAPNVLIKKWPEPGKRMRVAILPFKAHPANPASGELAYEAFSTNILEVKDYDVVDRGALEQVLKEQKLGLSGAIDQQKAVEIGKLLGAEGVILGTVTEYEPRNYLMLPPAKISLTARFVNTQTGEVEWTANQTRGGLTRWILLPLWPIWILATITSPTAEGLIQQSSRSICRTIEQKVEKEIKTK